MDEDCSFVFGKCSASESVEDSEAIWSIVSFLVVLGPEFLKSMALDSVILDSVVLGSVVLGSVVFGSVMLGSVVLDSVVLGSVVLGSVVLGSVVLGSVVLGSVVLGSVVFLVFVITKELPLLVTVLSNSSGTFTSAT